MRSSIALVIAAGAGIGAAIGDRVQPDLYIFSGSVALPSGEGADPVLAKQAHISAIRGKIPAAAAAMKMSAADFGNHMTLEDVPGTQLVAVRCTSRSSDAPLATINALIVHYCNNVPGLKAMPGTLDRSVRYASAGFVAGGGATGLMIVLRGRHLARRGRRGWVVQPAHAPDRAGGSVSLGRARLGTDPAGDWHYAMVLR